MARAAVTPRVTNKIVRWFDRGFIGGITSYGPETLYPLVNDVNGKKVPLQSYISQVGIAQFSQPFDHVGLIPDWAAAQSGNGFRCVP